MWNVDLVLKRINEKQFCDLEDVEWFVKDVIWLRMKEIMCWIDVDKHRHYELETVVYSIMWKFIWFRVVWTIYSECGSLEDIGHQITAFEMKEEKTTTYVKKE